jgi:glycosyltransferase involved in cell wall biosynthesis
VILHVQKVAGISGSEAHLLSLLPALRERGWDVRMLMLHEDEPGAWDFARALEARGVPLDEIRVRADVDPIAFLELVAYLVRRRPALLHTHLVHAEWYALLAGAVARVPVRFTTKHGFNEFREAPYFGVADRAVASLAHVHIAISRGLARYLADVEGFGMVALEAMERARPVIAAEIGGLGELVRDGETGVLVPAGEAELLCEAIVAVAGDLDLARRMGEAGRRRALSRFLQRACTERTELLYEGALATTT